MNRRHQFSKQFYPASAGAEFEKLVGARSVVPNDRHRRDVLPYYNGQLWGAWEKKSQALWNSQLKPRVKPTLDGQIWGNAYERLTGKRLPGQVWDELDLWLWFDDPRGMVPVDGSVNRRDPSPTPRPSLRELA